MTSHLKHLSLCLLSILVLPVLAKPAAIAANTVCELGNCSSPGTLSSGGSVGGTQNFTYTFADGDTYYVTTTYSATDTPITMNFSVDGIYTGNNGNSSAPSVAGDTLTVEFLQDFAYTGSSSATGTSTATLIEQGNAPGSYSEAELYFDGQGVGLMGPNYGPAPSVGTAGPTTINNLGNPVDGNFSFTLYFAPGTSPTAAPVPEPASLKLLIAAMLLAVPVTAYRMRRTGV